MLTNDMDCSFNMTRPVGPAGREMAWCRLISDSKHRTGDRMESYGHSVLFGGGNAGFGQHATEL